MRCTCGTASRDARNAALEEAAQWHDGRTDHLTSVHCEDDPVGAAAIRTHRFSAEHIRAMKAYDLKATVAELRELTKLAQRIAELEDHLSQANDTISRMSRCQTAADLQRMRETDRWGALKEAHGAWEWPGKDGGVDA